MQPGFSSTNRRRSCLFGRPDVRRLLALGARGHVEAHALAFFQRLEAILLDSGEMGEQILAAFRGRDEAEALGVVEPLDGACCHNSNFLKNHRGVAPTKKSDIRSPHTMPAFNGQFKNRYCVVSPWA